MKYIEVDMIFSRVSFVLRCAKRKDLTEIVKVHFVKFEVNNRIKYVLTTAHIYIINGTKKL